MRAAERHLEQQSAERPADPHVSVERGAKALRVAHIAIALAGLSSLGYVWLCALTGRRDRILGAALATLSLQSVGLLIGRGNCPLGPLQQRLGDPHPIVRVCAPATRSQSRSPGTGCGCAGRRRDLALRSRMRA